MCSVTHHTHTHTPTYAHREVPLVPDAEVEQQVSVELLEELLVLLIGHLLHQELGCHQDTHIHLAGRHLHTHTHKAISDSVRVSESICVSVCVCE